LDWPSHFRLYAETFFSRNRVWTERLTSGIESSFDRRAAETLRLIRVKAPASWYQFSPDRKGQHPKDHLAKHKGWMHADGYAGFEDLDRSGKIREVACMAHVRRKFVDIHRSQGSAIADDAIRRIAQLYAVEKETRGSPPDRRVELRQTKAKPIFDDLEAWLHAQLPSISGKSPLARAIRYALTRMARLRPYLDHGILELDTDVTEQPFSQLFFGFGGFSRQASTIFA
jgi:transposase